MTPKFSNGGGESLYTSHPHETLHEHCMNTHIFTSINSNLGPYPVKYNAAKLEN